MKLDDLLFALVAGLAIGAAVRAFSSRAPLWATVIAGVGGVLLGTFIYLEVLGFEAETPSIDWWRHLWQLVTAVVATSLVSTLARKLPQVG